ncbi:MAG: HAMP domain-containing sensor histidine kinase [Planctomycetota bacterium]|nr:HAMP domain-containing sensor histidine kinase [Planctomycetota bacterium]
MNQPLPFVKRIGFRIAVGIAFGFFVASWLTMPVWDFLWSVFHPDMEGLAWYEGWTRGELVAVSFMYTAVGATLGGIIGLIVTRASLAQLRRMAQQVSTPFGIDDALPGPFLVEGEDEVAQLARALNAMRARGVDLMESLRSRDAARSEWVAQVSHDLRTPLTALVTCLDLLEKRLESDGDAHTRELVSAALHDAERVSLMSEDLLRIARLEVDACLQRESVLPGELAEATRFGLSPLGTERGIELELDLPEDLSAIECDGGLMLRALENMVSNSMRHAKSRIVLRVDERAAGMRFTVTDDGNGLPVDGERVSFEDLRQARAGADSTGLGLMVTERVARAHGGEAGCRNAEVGAEVWIQVPLRRGA